MFEYAVRMDETGGTAEAEDICNRMAADGWRLVSTAAASAGALKVSVYLFFEREALNPPMPDEDMARLAAQFATAATR
jgi:hypothetical protein